MKVVVWEREEEGEWGGVLYCAGRCVTLHSEMRHSGMHHFGMLHFGMHHSAVRLSDNF